MKYIVELENEDPIGTGDPLLTIMHRVPEAMLELRLAECRPIRGGILSTWLVYNQHRYVGKIIGVEN